MTAYINSKKLPHTKCVGKCALECNCFRRVMHITWPIALHTLTTLHSACGGIRWQWSANTSNSCSQSIDHRAPLSIARVSNATQQIISNRSLFWRAKVCVHEFRIQKKIPPHYNSRSVSGVKCNLAYVSRTWMAQWLICRLHFGERCNSRPARWKIKVARRRETRERAAGERDEKWILLAAKCTPKESSPNTARAQLSTAPD